MNIHTPTNSMSDIAIKTQAVRFPCMTWEVQGDSILPIKGTWALPPMHLRHVFQRIGVDEKVKGLIACPNCNTPAILTSDLVEDDKVQHVGRVSLLRCSGCVFACEATLESWDTRKLYCVAFEVLDSSGKLRGNKEYYHGDSQADVAEQFWNGHMRDRNIVNIVGIGAVIGYFVDDKEGLKLHV